MNNQYEVEVMYWGRSADGDDYVDCVFNMWFDALDEAEIYIECELPFRKKDLIEVTILSERKPIKKYNQFIKKSA